MNPRSRDILLLLLAGALVYLPFLGGVHLFDWDEINFAEISREMILLKDYLQVHINFQPFWEKPPFFFWLQASGMHLLGVGEYAARLPNAINGMLTLVVVYRIGCRIYDRTFGLIWAGAWLGSVLPLLYAKSGIIDPWFNLFIFLGLYGFVLAGWQRQGMEGISLRRSTWTYLLLGGLAIGMGILTKGPVAFLLAVLTIGAYGVVRRFRWPTHPGHWLAFALAAAMVMMVWFGLETWRHGSWFLTEFFRYQVRLFSTPDAGHGGFPGYHVAVLLIGVFPVSVFVVRSFFRMPDEQTPARQDFRLWMKVLFWVVLVLFSVVRSKIVHYSSMAYLPMTYLGAVVIHHLWAHRIAWRGWLSAGLMSIGGLYVLVSLALPWLGHHIDLLKPFLASDPFALGNLEADVRWTGWEALPGIWLLAILVSTNRSFRREDWRSGLILLFGGTAIFVTGVLIFTIRNIEAYSQKAAITFFEARQGEEAYVQPVGYKTYAHLFYTRKPQVTDPRSYDQEWLLTGDIDKPVWFITRAGKEDRFDPYPDIRETGRKNGFVFFRRDPVGAGD